MSAQYRMLMEVKEVTDHDCGNYKIGEIDFGIRQAVLETYLRCYGLAGKQAVVQTLAYLIHNVEDTWRNKVAKLVEPQACAADPAAKDPGKMATVVPISAEPPKVEG